MPCKRVNANPYANHLAKYREWCETLPAMQWIRRAERSFDESAIQDEWIGPVASPLFGSVRLNEIRNRGHERVSECQRYFRPTIDITNAASTINPTGYQHYLNDQRHEKALWDQMLSMKRSDDGLTPTPRTAAAIAPLIQSAIAAREETRVETERSRSRGTSHP